jgi:hypothetical protein
MDANPDFKDLFSVFRDERVEFLVVGAHAVIFYAEPRFTKDLDVWVNPAADNARRVWQALKKFGAPLKDLRPESFADKELIYQIGVAPNRIDILMDIAGLTFEEAWPNRVESTYAGIPIYLPAKADLIRAKRATGRPQDQIDIDHLQE